MSIAGGALALSCPRTDFDQAFVLEQIQLAIRLHGAKPLVMMSHSDCGTYGGLAAFGGSQEREIEHHVTQLRGASKIAAGQFPGLLIERIFLRFDSVLSVGGHECAEHFQGS